MAYPNKMNSAHSLLQEDPRAEFLFEQIYQGVLQAQKSCPAVDRFYAIGGYNICLRFAGEAIIPHITRPLNHMACQVVASPDLTICICDSVLNKTAPPLMRSLNEYVASIDIQKAKQGSIYVHFDPGLGMFSLLNYKHKLCIHWFKDVAQLPYYEKGAPLRIILHWWMQKQGRQLIHGAAVGLPEGGVILAGKGGSGKSTTMMTSFESKLMHTGDDWNILGMDPHPAVYTVYNSFKLHPDHLRKNFPHLLPMVSNAQKLDAEKAMIFLHEHYPHKITAGFPIQAILLPRVTGLPETTLKKAGASEVLKAMFPETFSADYAYAALQDSFNFISTFAKQLPCYFLELGTDLPEIPKVIVRLIKSLKV